MRLYRAEARRPSCSKTMNESESLSNLRLGRSEMRPLPAACTLTSDAAAERRLAWQALADHALIEQRETERGLTLSYSAASGIELTARTGGPGGRLLRLCRLAGRTAGRPGRPRVAASEILSTRCRQCSPGESGRKSGLRALIACSRWRLKVRPDQLTSLPPPAPGAPPDGGWPPCRPKPPERADSLAEPGWRREAVPPPLDHQLGRHPKSRSPRQQHEIGTAVDDLPAHDPLRIIR